MCAEVEKAGEGLVAFEPCTGIDSCANVSCWSMNVGLGVSGISVRWCDLDAGEDADDLDEPTNFVQGIDGMLCPTVCRCTRKQEDMM